MQEGKSAACPDCQGAGTDRFHLPLMQEGKYGKVSAEVDENLAKERGYMIWGYDYSARLIVDLVILIVILSIHFIRRHIKHKTGQNGDEITENQTED